LCHLLFMVTLTLMLRVKTIYIIHSLAYNKKK
jgi:hypothetical protein